MPLQPEAEGGSLTVVSVPEGKVINQFHAEYCGRLCFSDDGSKLMMGFMTVGFDLEPVRGIGIWDLDSESLLYRTEFGMDVAIYRQFGASESLLRSGDSLFRDMVSVKAYIPVALSRDGSRLFAAHQDTVHVIDTDTGQVLFQLHGNGTLLSDIALVNDGRTLIGGGSGGRCLTWQSPQQAVSK